MDQVSTYYDKFGFKTLVFDNAMPESAMAKWQSVRKDIKFYKTIQNQMPMDFRVTPVNEQERHDYFELDDWLEPYLKVYHPNFDVKTSFARSFINCYEKGNHIKIHPDMHHTLPDEDLYVVMLLFLTPDEYINDPTDCGFIVNNSYETKDFIVHNKFNRMILMDARSLHEPVVPTDDVQRLTLYSGYTISPKNNAPDRLKNEKRLTEMGKVPGTRYQFNHADWIKVH